MKRQSTRGPSPFPGGAFDGDYSEDATLRRLYATDASEFQEMPAAVAMPRSEADLRALIKLAARRGVGLIARGAGTSLAGQVVGNGIVVDTGRHLNRILSIDRRLRRARVQPGVIRNELNMALAPHGLIYGPETSTANRAMIGGMVGNNSCGSNSIVYGSAREHLVSVRGFLSDGSEATFGPLDEEQFARRTHLGDRNSLYARMVSAGYGYFQTASEFWIGKCSEDLFFDAIRR